MNDEILLKQGQTRLASLACVSPCFNKISEQSARSEGRDSPSVRKSGTVPSRFARLGQSLRSELILRAVPSRFVRLGPSLRSELILRAVPSRFVRLGQSLRSELILRAVPSRFVRLGQSLCSERIFCVVFKRCRERKRWGHSVTLKEPIHG